MGTPQNWDAITIKQIRDRLFAKDWKEVIKIFPAHPELYKEKMTKSEDTVLHVVASTHGAGETLLILLDAMEEKDLCATRMALRAKNTHGDTPLHCAAARSSSPTMCERIVCIEQNLVVKRNKAKETPIFLAALHGQKRTFHYLHKVYSELPKSNDEIVTPPWRRKGGETILHCTLQREYFDLAFDIIQLYENQLIASSFDEKGVTPLHVLASKPSAFKSGTSLRLLTKMIYHCMVVEPLQLKVPDTKYEDHKEVEPAQNQSRGRRTVTITDEPGYKKFPENYQTCHEFFWFLWGLVESVNWRKGIQRNSERSEAGRDSSSYENSYFPLNYATFFEFFKSILRLLGIDLMSIRKVRQKHEWCAQIMDELVQKNSGYEWTDSGKDPLNRESDEDEQDEPNGNEKQSFLNYKPKNLSPHRQKRLTNAAQPKEQDVELKEMEEKIEAFLDKKLNKKQDPALREEIEKRSMTALLVAAKNGVIEMVRRILKDVPVAIHDRTKEEKNILHVAVENRQPHIFKELMKYYDQDNYLTETVDVKGNNVLHSAAKVSKYKPWRIPGSAMQMQWEIKWYQYVKSAVPENLIFQNNQDDDTPEEIFDESHKDLVHEGSEWLKSTSESCSVVAALIAGVSFATSSQVPGGNDDKTGKPTLEGQPAFNVFAITSLVSLSFSITALVMFLAILTSRKQAKDFRRGLPFKLLLGLSSLFVSIASILVSFCAAYFFVLKDKLSTGLYVIYTATCLPVSFYAVAQFPLYFDLLIAILTTVPEPSHKGDDL